MWRDDACVLDMLIAARKIRTFTDGVTLDRFLRDEMMPACSTCFFPPRCGRSSNGRSRL
jgi:uncharacterized protein with HEPN domain